MTSTIHADKIMNSSGDQDSGVDLLVNDQVKIKTANTDRVTVTDTTTTVSNDLAAATIKTATIKHTGGTTGLTIDSSGIVFQPTKPLFAGKLTSRMTISGSGHTHITTITEDFDQGNNHSGGTFTCPIAGKYRVHCSGSYRSNGASYVDLRIDHNSTYVARSYSELPNAAEVRTANCWHPFSCETIVNAAIGDTFKWYLGAGAGTSQLLEEPYTRFSVEFIG